MKTTTLDEFQDALRTQGAYETDPSRCAATRAKPSALTTLRYTWGVTRVFPMCALYQPLGLLSIRRWAGLCFSTVTVAERLGVRLHIEGFENRLKEPGPVVYLCNHMSMTETVLLPPVLLSFGPFNYVAKASLAHLPFLEKAAANMGMVPISRVSPREDLVNILRVGKERLSEGKSFLIFPQGTRSDVFSRHRFSSIGAKLAERAGVPVVPLVVDTRCQPTRRAGLFAKAFKDFGPVDTSFDIRVACGPVIPCARAKEMHEASFDWMADKLASWNLPVERA